MKVFIIGAGASCGTFPGRVPVAKEFGSVLEQVNKKWRRKYPALDQVVDHCKLKHENWDLTRVWTCIDYYVKLQCAIPRERVELGRHGPCS